MWFIYTQILQCTPRTPLNIKLLDLHFWFLSTFTLAAILIIKIRSVRWQLELQFANLLSLMQVLSSNLLHFVDLHSPNSRQTPQNLLLLPSRQAQATRRQVAVNLGQVKQTSLSFSLLDHDNNQDIRIAQVNSAFLPLLRGIPRNQSNLTHADSNKRYEVFLRPSG